MGSTEGGRKPFACLSLMACGFASWDIHTCARASARDCQIIASLSSQQLGKRGRKPVWPHPAIAANDTSHHFPGNHQSHIGHEDNDKTPTMAPSKPSQVQPSPFLSTEIAPFTPNVFPESELHRHPPTHPENYSALPMRALLSSPHLTRPYTSVKKPTNHTPPQRRGIRHVTNPLYPVPAPHTSRVCPPPQSDMPFASAFSVLFPTALHHISSPSGRFEQIGPLGSPCHSFFLRHRLGL